MSTMISRDPFAREEIHRLRVYTRETCRWCGQRKQTPRTGKDFLYQYSVESDGGRKSDIRGLFCSVGCMRSYTGS